MTELKTLKLLFLDCQTIGATPDAGHLLEVGWCLASACDEITEAQISSHLVKPDDFQSVPRRISLLTGIKTEDVLTTGQGLASVHSQLERTLKQMAEPKYAIAHFARFEKTFLEDLYVRVEEANGLPFKLLCTHDIAARLFPNLPARSLRALAGFFNHPITHTKRASHHIAATLGIWRGLVEELAQRDIVTLAQLEHWLLHVKRPKKEKHDYPIERLKRLSLPDTPGIYKMLSRNGEVLYVGKATSLKARVNSYFRGRKGRDTRKLEMLTQTWDIEVTATPTALEAALLESDEIKRLNPPYNIGLQMGQRVLWFLDRTLTKASHQQNTLFPYGPFTNLAAFETAQTLLLSARQEAFPETLFWSQFSAEELRQGFYEFCAEYKVPVAQQLSVRSLVALGAWLTRRATQEAPLLEDVAEEEEPPPLTGKEAIAGLCQDLFVQMARTRLLSRLLFAEVRWQEKEKTHALKFAFGSLNPNPSTERPAQHQFPWSGLGLQEYDRMIVLGSELKRMGRLIS